MQGKRPGVTMHAQKPMAEGEISEGAPRQIWRQRQGFTEHVLVHAVVGVNLKEKFGWAAHLVVKCGTDVEGLRDWRIRQGQALPVNMGGWRVDAGGAKGHGCSVEREKAGSVEL